MLSEHLRATVDAYSTTPRNERFTRVLRVLTQGWAGRRVVEIEYGPGVYDPGKRPRRARVRPYAIEPSGLTRALYLIGYDEDRRAPRTFKIERIQSASLTPEVFEGSSVTIARDLLSAWDVISDEPLVRVVLRFAPDVAARAAETRWHPSQEVEPGPDGSLVWQARISGLREVRSWILGWGAGVEVLEPAELRDWVRTEHEGAAARYR